MRFTKTKLNNSFKKKKGSEKLSEKNKGKEKQTGVKKDYPKIISPPVYRNQHLETAKLFGAITEARIKQLEAEIDEELTDSDCSIGDPCINENFERVEGKQKKIAR